MLDVVAFVANILTFARFWVKMTDETHTQPTLVQILIEIADFITTPDFKTFHTNFLKQNPYIAHTLIAYIFNITSAFIKIAKNLDTSLLCSVYNVHCQYSCAILTIIAVPL